MRLFPNVREAFLMLILVLQGIYLKKIILIYFFGTGGASTFKSVKGIPALRCNDFKVGPLTNSRARSPCP